MFDKEVYFKVPAAGTRRVADVERIALESLSKEQVYFL